MNDDRHTGDTARTEAERRLLASIDAVLEGADHVDREARGAAETTGDFESFRARCNAAYTTDAASEELRARRVANAVLARSTGEDLSRGRDMGLVLDFVSERLRASALLRVAAALLVVQVTLVPLIAWHVVRRAEEPVLHIRFEEQLEALGEELPAFDPDAALVPDVDPFEPDLRPLPLAAADTLSGAERSGLAALAVDARPTTELGRLLERATAALAASAAGEAWPDAAAALTARLGLELGPDEGWLAAVEDALRRVDTDDPYVSAWRAARAEDRR